MIVLSSFYCGNVPFVLVANVVYIGHLCVVLSNRHTVFWLLGVCGLIL